MPDIFPVVGVDLCTDSTLNSSSWAFFSPWIFRELVKSSQFVLQFVFGRHRIEFVEVKRYVFIISVDVTDVMKMFGVVWWRVWNFPFAKTSDTPWFIFLLSPAMLKRSLEMFFNVSEVSLWFLCYSCYSFK